MPGELAESRQRFGEVVVELHALLGLLRHSSGVERHLVYARCIPLLSEINALNKPPFPVRQVKALTHEASWHLRSLAGLATTKVREDKDHAAWAQSSLQALSLFAQPDPGTR